MRASDLLAAACGLVATTLVSGADHGDKPEAEVILLDLNDQAVEALEHAEVLRKRNGGDQQCTLSETVVRRDWVKLSKDERKDYTSAVNCLFNSPSKLREIDPDFAPGARTRYDDFVAIHWNQTLSIHGTGNFLTWHRYYVWTYEKALRDECGYQGYQPYWNWFAHVDDPTKSPVFDGSDTSMGGDGEKFEHNGTETAIGYIHVPPGNGGGCLKNGPFVDARINVGPVNPEMDGIEPNPNGPMGHNPRCLRRDLSPWTLSRWMTAPNLLNVTVGAASENISTMQTEFQGRFPDGFLGMHAAGHTAVGGEASDIYTSVNDPTFFLHHAMVDRIYWLWQALKPRELAMDIAGTVTVNNDPPSRDTVKTDPLIMGLNTETRPIYELLDTLGGTPLCYIYL